MPAVSTIRKHCRDWILTDILYCRICEKAARGWKLKFLINEDVEVDELSETIGEQDSDGVNKIISESDMELNQS